MLTLMPQELSGLLPTISETDPSRLSKHVVLETSIAHHRLQQSRCRAAIQHIQALTRERDDLLAEVNEWRRRYSDGGQLGQRQSVVLPNEEVADLLGSAGEQESSPPPAPRAMSWQSGTDGDSGDLQQPPSSLQESQSFIWPSIDPAVPENPAVESNAVVPPHDMWPSSWDSLPLGNDPFQIPLPLDGGDIGTIPIDPTAVNMSTELAPEIAPLSPAPAPILSHDSLLNGVNPAMIPEHMTFFPAFDNLNHMDHIRQPLFHQ